MTYNPLFASLAICVATTLGSCAGSTTNSAPTTGVPTATVPTTLIPDSAEAVIDTTATPSWLSFELLSWHDSITSELNNRSYCNIEVAYPTGDRQAVIDSIRTWIASQFDYFNYSGDLADGNRLIAKAGQSFIDSARNDFAALDTLDIKNISYADDYLIKPLYMTDSTATYANSMYWDRGGAHGASPFRVAVFNLNDGRRIGWDMFRRDRLETVRAMVRNEVKTQYFETDSEEEFNEMLLSIGTNEFPLSAQPPYFMADGVHVVYQQYEIAPYACGLPGCVIPYSSIYDLLTPEVQRLIPLAKKPDHD